MANRQHFMPLKNEKYIINTTHYHQLPFLTFSYRSGLHLDEVFIPALHLDQVLGVVKQCILSEKLLTSWKTWILSAVLYIKTNEDRIARDRLAVSQAEQNYKENISEHLSVAQEICSTSDVQIFMLTSFIFLGTLNL